MTDQASRRDVLLGAARWRRRRACRRTASADDRKDASSSAPGAATTPGCSTRISRSRCLIQEGWDVVQDRPAIPRRAKMVAEKRLPRGTTDVQGLSALNMFQMQEAGVREPIDYGKLKNAPQSAAVDEVPTTASATSIRARSSSTIRRSITTHRPASRMCSIPSTASKLGIIDIQYQYTIVAAALAAGGKADRSRARQEDAAGLQEGRRAHLSDQRGVRAGAQDRGDRHRRHVEGAHGTVAERRHPGQSRSRRTKARCPTSPAS